MLKDNSLVIKSTNSPASLKVQPFGKSLGTLFDKSISEFNIKNSYSV
jgi:hypothetical protein